MRRNGFLDRLGDALGRGRVGSMVMVTGVAIACMAVAVVLVAAAADAPPPGFWLVPVLMSVGWICAIALLWRMVRLAVEHAQSAEQAAAALPRVQATHQRLVDAVDAIPAGFALYDANERLVHYNSAAAVIVPYLENPDQTLIGLSFEEVLTLLEPRFRAIAPDLDLVHWRADLLRRFRERKSVDMLWANDRIVRISQVGVPSGGTVRIWVDVTDLKRSEEAARAAQAHFDALVSSLSDTVFSADRSGRINYLGSGKTLLGYAPEEILGRAPREVFHPDDLPRLDECIARLGRERGVPVALTFRGICKDGTIRHLEVRMTAPKAPDNLGGELAITGTIRDVQAQHELAERLRYEVQRLDSVVQSTGAHIVLVDRNMRIIMANKGFLSIMPGAAMEDVIGRPMRDVINSPVDQEVFDAWFAAAASEPINGIEYEKVWTDHEGRQRLYHITANPVRDGQGCVQHIVFLSVDETERRAAELQLFAASRLATLGEMASGVAHEINQPLTIIRFGVENLQEHLKDMPPQTTLAAAAALIDEKLSRIIGQTDRAATIIGDLKGFARKSDEAPGLFDVSASLAAAAHLLREQLRVSDVDLVLAFDAACPPVLGNSSRLQQVVINLILNARDAIVDHGVAAGGRAQAGTIRLRTQYVVATGKVIATVEDDGHGIPGDVLSRVFEPFFTTKPTGKGTGLGLSVSYQIIRQMGGTIAAENRAEGGARFTIALDAAPGGIAAGMLSMDLASWAAA